MRCLNCGTKGILLDATICPKCGVHLPSLLRDVLPYNTILQDGKYQIDYAIGRGGFGVTYQAQHVPLEKPVAIKEFFPQESALREGTTGSIRPMRDTEGFNRGLERFRREGKILAKVEHSSIVRASDFFEERGTGYLVMELLHGESLREELDRAGGKLTESRVREVLDAMVEGLTAVHQREIFHLDLKPENVMVMANGRIVLVDFGAAKQETGIKRKDSSTRAFTMAYAAPEVLAGRPVGAASDIFELGMMVHEMLVGELPPSAMERFMPGGPVWSPSKLAEPWQALISQALEIDPKLRPNNVKDWTSVLKESPAKKIEKESDISAPSPKVAVPKTSLFVPVVHPVAPKKLESPTDAIQIDRSKNIPQAFAQSQEVSEQVREIDRQQHVKAPSRIPESQPKIALPSKIVLLLGTGAVLLSIAGVTVNNIFAEQARLAEQAEKQKLEKIKTSKAGSKYAECSDTAKSVQSSSRIYAEAQSLLKECQVAKVNTESGALLATAKDLAKKDLLEMALATARKIDPSSSVYAESQKLVEQWSQSLLQVATSQYQDQGKLKEAIALTQSIPTSSAVGKKLPELTSKWQTEWKANETASNVAQKALKERRWNDVLASSKKVTTAYWIKQTNPMVQKANAAVTPVYVAPAQPVEPAYQPPAQYNQGYQPPVNSPSPRSDRQPESLTGL